MGRMMTGLLGLALAARALAGTGCALLKGKAAAPDVKKAEAAGISAPLRVIRGPFTV